MSEWKKTEIGVIPKRWELKTVEDAADYVTDYVANGSFASLKENVTYKSDPDYAILIRLKDYNNDFNGDFVYVDEHAYNFLKKSKLFGGEIIISNVGAYSGTVFYAPDLGIPMTLGPNAIMMNFSSGNSFYYYWFKGYQGQHFLDGIISGSAQPKFNKTSFRNLKVPVPPLPEQKAIAGVLSSLDDKIDLLRRQNQTLEALAETLFRQWFVEEAEDDWEESNLSEAIEIVGGGTPKTNREEYWGGEIFWLSGGDISKNHKNYIVSSEKKITKVGLNNSSTRLLPKFSTIITARGTVGKFCILAKPMAFSQTNYGIMPKYKNCYFFTYLLINHSVTELMSAAYGSVFDTITTKTFEDFKVKIPPVSNILSFENNVKAYFLRMMLNQNQIQTLENLRDTLLPKLMSGKVRVNYDQNN